MQDLRMELKVCEGCGVLWLRTAANQASNTLANTEANPTRRTCAGNRRNINPAVYCRTCTSMFAEFPPTTRTKALSRPRVRRQLAVAVAGGAR